MGKVFAILIILFFGLIAYLGFLNQSDVAIKLTRNHIYEIPMVIFIIISSLSGALFVFVFYTIRDTKRLIRNIKIQKKQKQKDRIESIYNEALSALYARKNDLARKRLKELLELDPSHLKALLRLAEIAYDEDNLKEAFEYYHKVVALEPDNVGVKLRMAEIKLLQKEYEDALSFIEDVLRSDPRNMAALLEKRRLLEIKGRWHDLIELQKEIMKHTGNEEKAREERRLLGYNYEEARELIESGELDRAKKILKSILKTSSDFIPAHVAMAEILIRRSQKRDAINYLEKVFEETDSLVLVAMLEDMVLSEEEPSRIISIYRKAIGRRPDDTRLKYLLLKLYYRLEMLDDALELIEEFENQRVYPDLKKIKAAIAIKRGNYEEAANILSHITDMGSILKPSLCCSECGWVTDEWQGRCPSCGDWNSLDLDIKGACKISKVQAVN